MDDRERKRKTVLEEKRPVTQQAVDAGRLMGRSVEERQGKIQTKQCSESKEARNKREPVRYLTVGLA